MEFLMALLEHPVILVVLLMVFMGLVGMTYEFVLRLLGKKSIGDGIVKSSTRWPDDLEGDPPPPMPMNVPKPPTGPKDTLVEEAEIEGGEEVEDDDGNVEFHYIYKSDELAPSYWMGYPFKGKR